MTGKTIITFDNDSKGILSRKAKPVPTHAPCRAIIEYMFDAMNYPKGIGLAAPQIGEDARIIVINVPHMKHGRPLSGSTKHAIINPEITWMSGQPKLATEGCLSFPGKNIWVPRAPRVKVSGFNVRWEPITIGGKGLVARVLQHEIDHLNGITLDFHARQPYNQPDKEQDVSSAPVRD